MSTTGLYSYNPATSNLTLVAFGRIGIRRTAITAEHMADADNEMNLVQVELSNKQPNLWRGQTYESELEEGVATSTLPEQVIAIAAAYISITTGDQTIDRIIWPYSTFEYAAIPNKLQQGVPTSYWYDRQATPQITFWPVPDADDTYTAKLRVFSQIQDASLKAGYTLDLPYRWLDVFVANLAHRLSRIYAPDKEAMRKADAQEAWVNAATEDQENVPLYIAPATDGYWR